MGVVVHVEDGSRAGECVVKAVTVYSDRAEVTRALSVDLCEGEQDIRVCGVPALVQENSIRVLGSHASCTILEVSSHAVTDDGDDAACREASVARLREVRSRLTAIDNECSSLDVQKSLLERQAASMAAASARGGEAGGVDALQFVGPEALRGVAAFRAALRKHTAAVHQRLPQLAAEKESLEKERLSLEAEDCAFAMRPRPKEVVISVYVEETCTLELLLCYLVSGASWRPEYDVRASSQEEDVVLTCYGAVQQKTGEDWTEVSMSLSTAVPSADGSPPELPTTILTFANPSLDDERGKRKGASKGAASPLGSHRGTGQEENGPTTEALPERFTACTLAASRVATVESNGCDHRVPLVVKRLQAVFSHVIVPKLAQEAYLSARMVNSAGPQGEGVVLLPGTVRVFMDGTYVCSTAMGRVNVNERFELSLGVDQTVKVDYLPVQTVNERQGMISKTQQATYEHTTRVKNTKGSPIALRVFDQLPKPVEEKIKVKLLQPTQAEATVRDGGEVEWQVPVAPAKKVQVLFKYTVEWCASPLPPCIDHTYLPCLIRVLADEDRPSTWTLDKNFAF